jgi:hypothetical protein
MFCLVFVSVLPEFDQQLDLYFLTFQQELQGGITASTN